MSTPESVQIDAIGFPPPLLGSEALRLPVCFDDGDLLAVVKPIGVLVQADPWFPRLPMLVEAIRYQAAQGKPELKRGGVGPDGLWAISDLDPHCHGPVLFARTRATADALRNELGSAKLEFQFELLVRDSQAEPEFVCDLPLARHREDARVLVSNKTGKRTTTTFKQLDSFGRYSLWSASCTLPRRHQILVHALESGIPIVGDHHYGRSQLLMLSNIKRSYQPRTDRPERPLYAGPVYRLAAICAGSDLSVNAPPDSKWKAMLTQIRRCG